MWLMVHVWVDIYQVQVQVYFQHRKHNTKIITSLSNEAVRLIFAHVGRLHTFTSWSMQVLEQTHKYMIIAKGIQSGLNTSK